MSINMDNSETKSEEPPKSKNWLRAHENNLADLYSISQCMCLCDVVGENENCLVVADLTDPHCHNKQMKLKVYKGVQLIKETNIIDLPTGTVSFFLDQNEPRTPAVAVASGAYIYVYKNMKPYFKFTLPLLEVDKNEENFWKMYSNGKMDSSELKENLGRLRQAGVALTVRSVKTLAVAPEKLEEFCAMFVNAPLKRQTVATCLTTMKKSHNEVDAISCLVVGTETGQLLVIDPEAFTVLFAMNLDSTPVFICATGLYDVEFRVYVACRNGCVYVGKRGVTSPRRLVYFNTQPLGMIRIGKTLVFGCMDETLRCVTPKGREIWRRQLPAGLVSMCSLESDQHNISGVLVSLADATVRLYHDRDLVESISVPDTVTGLMFGPFGREQFALVMVTRSGSLIIELLKRTAKLTAIESHHGPPREQMEKLNIPKKTKLFIDHAFRERDNAVSIHRRFAQDLAQLRLSSARDYLDVLSSRQNPISGSSSTNPGSALSSAPSAVNAGTQPQLRLAIQVHGLGPLFSMNLHLENSSSVHPVSELTLIIVYDPSIYSLQRSVLPIPYLLPSTSYPYSVSVECINDKGISDTIKVLVVRASETEPLVTGLVNMPVSEAHLAT